MAAALASSFAYKKIRLQKEWAERVKNMQQCIYQLAYFLSENYGGLAMAIQLLGFPTTLGLPRDVDRHAPEVLRESGLIRRMHALGHQVIDHGDMALLDGRVADSPAERVRRVVKAAERQRDHWLKVHRSGDLLFTIGGDHSTSLGTIWALRAMEHDFDVIWVDAHGDYNVMETSPSGNPHGMVLAMAAGLFPGLLPRLVSPDRLKLWGIRDLDTGERDLLRQTGVEVLSPEQFRQNREQIIGRLKPSVLLSFDIDSVDPADAPGTMTPVPGGFRREEALQLAAAVARQRRILALDLVEYHPDQDRANMTARLALDVVQAAISGQATQREAAAGD